MDTLMCIYVKKILILIESQHISKIEAQIDKRPVGQTVKRSLRRVSLVAAKSRESLRDSSANSASSPQRGTGNPKRQHFGGSQDRRERWRFARSWRGSRNEFRTRSRSLLREQSRRERDRERGDGSRSRQIGV